MLQFLQPLWLCAISGIIVPLIIHLWNIKQGKVLKVGSVAFLQNSAKKYSKSFKVNEWLLLLLRCLLIIVSSIILAQPYWKQLQKNKEKGWLLIDKQGFGQGYKIYQPVIDSLIKNNFSLHYFNDDFTAVTLTDALKESIKTENLPISYWNLILRLDKKINASLPIYLITNNSLKHFTGERPTVETSIRWLTYSLQDSIKKHIRKAFLDLNDSIYLIIDSSAPTANLILHESLSKKTGAANNYITNIKNGNLVIKYKNDSTILVDTSILKITIYTAQNGNDGTYLKAAFNAIQNFTKRRMQMRVVKDLNLIPDKQDWLFWLSNQPLPNNITANNLFAYAGGKEQNTNSWINATASNVDNNSIQLLKRITPVTVSAKTQIMWKDGFGNPMLTKENSNQSNVYRFYNRFDPAWNNLVWGNSFPTLLASIIFGNDTNYVTGDKRIIDERQLKPLLKPFTKKSTIQINTATSDISNIFWLSLFVIFFTERIVSFRTKKADA